MSIPEIITAIQSSNNEQQFLATTSCRRMLSRERKPPIDDVIKANLLPRLVEFLSRFDRCDLVVYMFLAFLYPLTLSAEI